MEWSPTSRAFDGWSANLNLDPGNQVFANLDTLERLCCISRPALYLGHALRRLSNDAFAEQKVIVLNRVALAKYCK